MSFAQPVYCFWNWVTGWARPWRPRFSYATVYQSSYANINVADIYKYIYGNPHMHWLMQILGDFPTSNKIVGNQLVYFWFERKKQPFCFLHNRYTSWFWIGLRDLSIIILNQKLHRQWNNSWNCDRGNVEFISRILFASDAFK